MATTPPNSTTGAAERGDTLDPPSVLALMFSRRIAWSALKVSLVVGTVLNVVNNGERLMAQGAVSLWQVAMNFVVPFCVSSYSAARNEAQRAKGGG